MLEPAASLAIARRYDALGGRFLLYLLTFILSQSPCLVRHLLIVAGVRDTSWEPGFDYMSDAICPLHGFLNGALG